MIFFIKKTSKYCRIKELCIVFLLFQLSSCSLVNSNDTSTEAKELSLQSLDSKTITNKANQNNKSTEWLQKWGVRKKGKWGLDNISLIKDSSGRFDKVLRVRYPAGSVSPSYARKTNKPIGGGQFFADLGISPTNTLRLSYYLRFSKDFDFVKGGKLPGLFGGTQVSGGKIPDGTNGFSTRFMWRRNGDGELYAYLPNSKKYGTSIGRGNWQFIPGKWHHLEQELILNKPGINDGRIKVWLDGKEVLDKGGLTFRTTENLKIEGIFFCTFFGGSSSSWATPKDVEVDFADFSVSKV
ncbi:MAG: polysaccharide lyase [Rivularia sp. (in: cyanobacteria)]